VNITDSYTDHSVSYKVQSMSSTACWIFFLSVSSKLDLILYQYSDYVSLTHSISIYLLWLYLLHLSHFQIKHGIIELQVNVLLIVFICYDEVSFQFLFCLAMICCSATQLISSFI